MELDLRAKFIPLLRIFLLTYIPSLTFSRNKNGDRIPTQVSLRSNSIADCQSAASRASCVCELQEALDEPQVKMSKHIGYMKRQGLLDLERKANWNFYRISPKLSEALLANLEVIRTGYAKDPQLSQDLEKLEHSPGAACR